jgi:hypothetical protein
MGAVYSSEMSVSTYEDHSLNRCIKMLHEIQCTFRDSEDHRVEGIANLGK